MLQPFPIKKGLPERLTILSITGTILKNTNYSVLVSGAMGSQTIPFSLERFSFLL